MSFTLISAYKHYQLLLLRKIPLNIVLGLLTLPTHAADFKQTLDWVPLDQLTQEQRDRLPLGSCGAYISPVSHTDNTLDLDAPIQTSSNKSEIIDKNGSQDVSLIGDVIVNKGYRQLTADQALYSEETGTIIIDGELTIREPDLLLIADKGVINQRQDTLIIDNATYVIHSSKIRGKSKQLSKNQQTIRLNEGEYTRCTPGNNDWVLRGSQIVINTKANQGVATNVSLVVKGIPVFYWPYLRFPVGDSRQSGFLYPTIESSDGDFNVSVPYYFNLAPNYDLLFTPHFLHHHGVLFEANARHLSQHFETDINLTYLNDDKGILTDSETARIDDGTPLANGSIPTEATINPFKGTDRWAVNIHQKGGKGKRWSTLVDYNEVSDNDYLKDFDSSRLNRNSDVSLKQQIKVGYEFNHWNLKINSQQFQTLDDTITKPFKELPEITLNGNYNRGIWNARLDNEWIRFDHSDADNPDNTTLVGNRLNLKYALELDHETDAIFFRPRIQARHLSYNLNENKLDSGANNTPSITVPQAVLDTGIFFEREGASYTQTFEPRLYYFYSPSKNQSSLTDTNRNINFDTSTRTFNYNQLFNDTRFSGGDRIDDANQISVGLTTRFTGQKSGLELFTASIGKSFYLEERQVTLNGTPDSTNNSPIAGQINANFTENWSLHNDIIYDDDINKFTNTASALSYQGKDGSLFNLRYRFLRSRTNATEITTDQIGTSFIQPIVNKQWYLFGHIEYDYNNDRELERFFGIEYNSCCYRVRLAHTRFIDDDQVGILANGQRGVINSATYDEGIILEFQFLGLGSTGKRFEKLLDNTIDGYKHWKATHR
ncbi:hypothetical protein AB835_07175 [Candidatus Endobugula sertula]|uniref:LPS-assembly protein LptD n=1 Tax=Candidatus Endobugula sertula TaxID=62101 RepID=A0A1D2QQ92_9GAMM|nr:hypothetical protein AB835_07175 [Candidatus Endobugula sertula]